MEDAFAGVDAALAAGMRAFGVGGAAGHPGVHGSAPHLTGVVADDLIDDL